jgi:hypothetical protein
MVAWRRRQTFLDCQSGFGDARSLADLAAMEWISATRSTYSVRAETTVDVLRGSGGSDLGLDGLGRV